MFYRTQFLLLCERFVFFFFLPIVLDAKPPQCSALTSWSNFICLKKNSKISVLISKHWDSLGGFAVGMDFSVQWESRWLTADARAVPEPQELLVCCARLLWPLADSGLIRGVLEPALLVHSQTNILLLWWTPPTKVWFSRQGRHDRGKLYSSGY